MFARLKIEVPPLSTVQVKCIYTILKRRTRKFNFSFYVLNLIKINIRFCLSKVGSPEADISANSAKIVESSGPVYRPTVPQ